MNIIDKIAYFVANKMLRNKVKKLYRKTVYCKINDAKSIGVVSDSSKADSRKAALILSNLCKKNNITYELLSYSEKENEDVTLISDNNNNYIYHKDFTFFRKPQNQVINNFIDKEFDILINLYQQEHCFEVGYIVKLSKAKFKVGSSKLDKSLHDMIIELKDKDAVFLVEQIINYLKGEDLK